MATPINNSDLKQPLLVVDPAQDELERLQIMLGDDGGLADRVIQERWARLNGGGQSGDEARPPPVAPVEPSAPRRDPHPLVEEIEPESLPFAPTASTQRVELDMDPESETYLRRRLVPHPIIVKQTDWATWRDFGYVRVVQRSLWWVLLWACLASAFKFIPWFVSVGSYEYIADSVSVCWAIVSLVYCLWWYAPTTCLAVRYRRLAMLPNQRYDVRPINSRHAPLEFQPSTWAYEVTSCRLYLGWKAWFRLWGIAGMTFTQCQMEFGWDVRTDMEARRLRPMVSLFVAIWRWCLCGWGSFRAIDGYLVRVVYVSQTLVTALTSRRTMKCHERSIKENEAMRLLVSVNIDGTDLSAVDILHHSVDMAYDIGVYCVARDGWNQNHHFCQGAALYW